MKVLFIGGTGNISTSSSRLALENGIELFLMNRGKITRPGLEGARHLKADIHKADEVKKAIKGNTFDVVANFIAFTPDDVQRDIELFKGITKQYIFISSASAYQKPPTHWLITESTPLANPYWKYSRDKIACEELLMKAYREEGFPVTIVRPSHTYDTVIPVAIGSWEDYTIVDRMKKGKPVIVHGDGFSLWTLTHSEDFAKAFAGLLANQQSIGHSFHITSDEVLNWNQIYQTLAEAAGVEANILHVSTDMICEIADSLGQSYMRGNLLGDKAISAVFDTTKIKRFVPGFVATIPFRQGIKRTLDWFEAEPLRMKISKENQLLMDTIVSTYTK